MLLKINYDQYKYVMCVSVANNNAHDVAYTKQLQPILKHIIASKRYTYLFIYTK